MVQEHLKASLEGIRQLLSHLQGEITHLEASYSQMLLDSNQDDLTGLMRRKEFFKQWNQSLVDCQNQGVETGLILVDIDHFKAINDTQGHLTGDEVLKAVAGMIKSLELPPSIIAGRFGGEEFVISVRGSSQEIADLSERIRKQAGLLTGPILGPDGQPDHTQSWKCTLSGGWVSSREMGYDPNRLLAAADEALYFAKRAGRNQVKAA